MKPEILIGSSIGSIMVAPIPLLWGADLISYSVAAFSCLGSLAGWWIGHKMSAARGNKSSANSLGIRADDEIQLAKTDEEHH
jgi:membrane protein YqaA with SNARE-associated domain